MAIRQSKTKEFLAEAAELVRMQLPPELRDPCLVGPVGTLVKLHYGDPKVHYEVWVRRRRPSSIHVAPSLAVLIVPVRIGAPRGCGCDPRRDGLNRSTTACGALSAASIAVVSRGWPIERPGSHARLFRADSLGPE